MGWFIVCTIYISVHILPGQPILFLRIVNGTNYYQNLSHRVRRFRDDKLITLEERINNISHHLLISRLVLILLLLWVRVSGHCCCWIIWRHLLHSLRSIALGCWIKLIMIGPIMSSLCYLMSQHPILRSHRLQHTILRLHCLHSR